MILLGAGSSAPFGIPTMKGFVSKIETDVSAGNDENEKKLISLLKESMEHAKEYVGTSFTYDLESLMAVLESLAEKRPSVPAMAFVCHASSTGLITKPKFADAEEKFGKTARTLLVKVKKLVFQEAVKPVKERQEMLAKDLDKLYGPLFMLLAATYAEADIEKLSNTRYTNWIFTTNWDSCIEKWIKYRDYPLNDGMRPNSQGERVLNVDAGWGEGNNFNVVPIHGAVTWIKTTRQAIDGKKEDILKIYPEFGKEEMAESIFIIYPLEAIGYESVVRSPYLEMLRWLKEKLRDDDTIFVIGFSFRDPTVASVFEDALRVRKSDWTALEVELEERVMAASKHKTKRKIVVLDSNRGQVLENVKEFYNLHHAIIPIKMELPSVGSPTFDKDYAKTLLDLGSDLGKLFGREAFIKNCLKKISEMWGFVFPTDTDDGEILLPR